MTKAIKLDWAAETKGEPIKLTRAEATTLMGFRRSAYSAPLKEILLSALDSARINNEEQAATEENRQRVAAVKEVLAVLFDNKVELK